MQKLNKDAVIYNGDSREDLTEEDSVNDIANATAILIEDKKLQLKGLQWMLKTRTLNQSYPLCEDEPFQEQPLLGFCTGVLIAPDKVLTAGHCMTSQNRCATTKFVFGWNLSKSQSSLIPEEQIFHCQSIQSLSYDRSNDIDYAVVVLDRAVHDVSPVEFAEDISLEHGENLISLSYPLGLPLKKDVGTVIENISDKNIFKVEVDTFGGSSGSPLFNSQHQLVGILSRGMEDILEDDIYRIQTYGGCINFNRCKDGYCTGERFFKVNRIPKNDF